MTDWDYWGIFPNGVPTGSSPFYGRHGIKSYAGNPYPAGVVTADHTEAYAPDEVHMVCVAINTQTYQWQKSSDGTNWSNISGATTTEYTANYPFESGVAGDHYYRVLCTGWFGTVPTEAVKITVAYHAPVIEATTSTPRISAPGIVELSGTAQYASSYQWQQSSDGISYADIAGATTLEYSLAVINPGDMWYRCKATGLGGTVTSSPVRVEIGSDYEITISADSLTPAVGEIVTMTASTEWIESIEWQQSTDGVTWIAIPGATSWVNTFTPSVAGTTYFRAIGMYSGGSVTSNELTITAA